MYRKKSDFYYELDIKIKKYLFPKKKLSHYSTDRRYIGIIIEKIYLSDEKIIFQFNNVIHNQFRTIFESNKEIPNYAEFLLACTPDEVCKAAIMVFENIQ